MNQVPFSAIVSVVNTLAATCPEWIMALVGWKKNPDEGEDGIEIIQFDALEGEGFTLAIRDEVRKLILSKFSGSSGLGDTERSAFPEEEERDEERIEDDDIHNCPPSILDNVTRDTEKLCESQALEDVESVAKIVGSGMVEELAVKCSTHANTGHQACEDWATIPTDPRTPIKKKRTASAHQIITPETPRNYPRTITGSDLRLWQSPATQSRARTIRFLDTIPAEPADAESPAGSLFSVKGDESDGRDGEMKGSGLRLWQSPATQSRMRTIPFLDAIHAESVVTESPAGSLFSGNGDESDGSEGEMKAGCERRLCKRRRLFSSGSTDRSDTGDFIRSNAQRPIGRTLGTKHHGDYMSKRARLFANSIHDQEDAAMFECSTLGMASPSNTGELSSDDEVLLTPTPTRPARKASNSRAGIHSLAAPPSLSSGFGSLQLSCADESHGQATPMTGCPYSQTEPTELDPGHLEREQNTTVDTEEQQDVLVTTPVMKAYGLAFNRKYNLVICVPCGEGHRFDKSLHRHLLYNISSRLNWNPASRRWMTAGVSYEHHLVAPKNIPAKKKFLASLYDSLIEYGFIQNGSELRGYTYISGTDWRRDSPRGESSTNWTIAPVEGLRVFGLGYACMTCGYGSPIIGTMNNHFSSKNKTCEAGKMQICQLQTLSEVSGYECYFPVLPPISPQATDTSVSGPPTNNPKLIDRDHAQKLLMNRKLPRTNVFEMSADSDTKAIPAVFVSEGVDGFLKKFNRRALVDFYTPDRSDDMFTALRRTVQSTYEHDLEQIRHQGLHGSIMKYITNCTPDYHLSRHFCPEFSPLVLPKTITAYASVECYFVWAMIHAYRSKEEHCAGLFSMSSVQLEALRALDKVVDSDNHTTVSDALYNLLDTVYFPLDYSTQCNAFNHPPVAFLALRCLDNDGSYRFITLIPPIMAMLQYSFRLRACRKFVQWNKSRVDSNNMTDEEFMRLCKEFCRQHLQNYNLSPFSALRNLLHKTSVVAWITNRPTSFWWALDKVQFGLFTINFLEYKSFLQDKINTVESLVLEEILFGLYTLEEIDAKIVSIREPSSEEDTIGNGTLLDARSISLDNEDSTDFFERMFQINSLELALAESRHKFTFNRRQGLVWLSCIDNVMTDIFCLAHCTEGPSPGLMTEDVRHRITNTSQGKRNVVFEKSEGTGGFRTSTEFMRGSIFKQRPDVLRLLPYRVFRLLFIMTRIVRPIEVVIALDSVVKPEDREVAVTAYREQVWVTYGRPWNTQRLQENLRMFLKIGLNINMGPRLYRYFASAVQRHYPETKYGNYEDYVLLHPLAALSDEQANHMSNTAEGHYAKEGGTTSSATRRALEIRISKDWHRLLGLSTASQ